MLTVSGENACLGWNDKKIYSSLQCLFLIDHVFLKKLLANSQQKQVLPTYPEIIQLHHQDN